MTTLFEKASEIIREASATQRSLYVFCILVSAVLVFVLFRKERLWVRIGGFVVTLAVMALGTVAATPLATSNPNWQVRVIDWANVDSATMNTRVATAINEMKPKNIKSITGFLRQEPTPAGRYKVVVLCDCVAGDRAGLEVNVDQRNLTHSERAEDVLNTLISTDGSVALLGYYHGSGTDAVFYAYPKRTSTTPKN